MAGSSFHSGSAFYSKEIIYGTFGSEETKKMVAGRVFKLSGPGAGTGLQRAGDKGTFLICRFLGVGWNSPEHGVLFSQTSLQTGEYNYNMPSGPGFHDFVDRHSH